MNVILGYISTAFIIAIAIAVYLIIASMVNDSACASLELHSSLGKPLMQFLFVCW